MEIEEKIQNWIELSASDFEAAKSMLESGRYLYVGFMCHLSVEKIIKALFVHNAQDVPENTHNLMKFAKEGKFYDELSDAQRDLLDQLDPLNIEASNPSYEAKLLQLLNYEICENTVIETRKLLNWIRAKIAAYPAFPIS